ncbi:putative quinol monooxygenase [Pseudomonas gingeri]|uniref:Antibiotic biosynthesis monooxygenase n=1 Tax=Pseudomonas gingeri TaxID=117681 RepID=A0A7Y8CK59_9PSED|nr:putative quinol monooxygenase [Pseudomonas gingeri]NVZ66495.1 antibiotic biosynthesis monooxygenase [Pseudomonas gingeri]NVZ74584.1 antibiotic biosynthesis monooxygenase [Pseudomonas gingeri]NVZ99341.1 antibiotic biosynthesis monooxygenase [Pseudomonas gingeri]NWA13386.1 antibiotic biosynthesis monooxygenase [Pseudomonas gingeri]NWA55647.1 antibiotic biosynthesis monooxygenase [Pseudomonas gingeri]
MSAHVINIVRFKAVPGRSEALGQHLNALVETLRPAPGCLDYSVVCGGESGDWTVTGHWQSPDALQAHFQLPALQGFIDLLGSLACGIDFQH